jgi:hypothetical protein
MWRETADGANTGGPSYRIFAIKPFFNCQKKLKFRRYNLKFPMYEMAESFFIK